MLTWGAARTIGRVCVDIALDECLARELTTLYLKEKFLEGKTTKA